MKTEVMNNKTCNKPAGTAAMFAPREQFQIDAEFINMNSAHTGQNPQSKLDNDLTRCPTKTNQDGLANSEVGMPIMKPNERVGQTLVPKQESTYLIEVDNVKIEWVGNHITGLQLKELASVCPHEFALWQKRAEAKDLHIANDEVELLNSTSCCSCYTIPIQTMAADAVVANALPRQDVAFLKNYSYDTIVDKQQTGIVLHSMDLPPGKYDHGSTDILILLPTGYPDVPPDMFYCKPWIRLLETDSSPHCAGVPFYFANDEWQRWSRHSNTWQPGKDGIETVIKRIKIAIEEA